MTPPSVRLLPEAVEDLLENQRWCGRLEPELAPDFAEEWIPDSHPRFSTAAANRAGGYSSCLKGGVPVIGKFLQLHQHSSGGSLDQLW
jgi:hypothetical protein